MPIESSCRLPLVSPDELTTEQRDLYRAITEGPRRGSGIADTRGCLRGPFNAMLYSPAIGAAMQELGAAIRYRSTLPDRARELAILTVAARCGSEFEWVHHEPLALKCGWHAGQLMAIRENREPSFEDPAERATWQVATRILAGGTLDDQEYERALELLGHVRLVELSALVGYYRLLADQLRLFDVPVDR